PHVPPARRRLVGRRRRGPGWLGGACRALGRPRRRGRNPRRRRRRAWVEQLRLGAETVLPGHGPAPAASAEESECVLRWLERDGTRLIDVDGQWQCPVRGATRHLTTYDPEPDAVVPFDERRLPRTVHQPSR